MHWPSFSFTTSSHGGSEHSYASIAGNVFWKLIFKVCVLLQVVLWPTMISIVFACVIAIEGIISIFMNKEHSLWDLIASWGIGFFHGGKAALRNYVFSAFIGIYMAAFFMQFWVHEASMQPRMTSWIHPSRIHNYSFTENQNNPLPDVEVTSSISKDMRSNSFVWPKEHVDYAVRLNGTLGYAGPNQVPLLCKTEKAASSAPSSNASGLPSDGVPYACFSSKLAVFKPSNEDVWGPSPRVVPMPSQFYFTDVMVVPPQGTRCKDLEVYRIILDSNGDVASGLDFPSSSSAINPSSQSLYKHCGLFGDGNWCLHSHHTFDHNEYQKRVEAKCAQSGDSLEFRLPVRSLDLDPSSGKSSLDALIVTRGALVKLKFSWSNTQEETKDMFTLNKKSTLTTWSSWHTSNTDSVQGWRESTDSFAVFLKFAIVSTPLFMVWYFLTVQFSNLFKAMEHNQVIVLCIFVLIPSILLFLSIGAWLPMAGSIVCGIVVNHIPAKSNEKGTQWWKAYFRPALFFITAVCNSIQFAWILALYSQAGWNAFFYDFSLHQLSEISSNFIISGSVSTNWISLILPCVLLVNASFLVGSAICIVLEVLEYWGHFKHNPAQPQG